MNILPVNSMNNNTFGTKLPGHKAEIKVIGELDEYAEQMLDSVYGDVLHQADAYSRPVVKFAQKGDKLLINSGIITSVMDMKKEPFYDFFKKVFSNIQANEVATRGLKEGFSRLV